MFRGSKHGVLQYTMGKIATELMERYSGAIMAANPSCHQEFESILLPLFSLMADDMMQQLVDNVRLGITDQVYDWNRIKEDDEVNFTPEVSGSFKFWETGGDVESGLVEVCKLAVLLLFSSFFYYYFYLT